MKEAIRPRAYDAGLFFLFLYFFFFIHSFVCIFILPHVVLHHPVMD